MQWRNYGNIGDNVKVHTHYHVREDNISLYGFLTCEELRMFELLISTSGIGAKSALVILENIEPHTFALAIITDDDEKLVKIPGIGKKTAARMILELKDKMKTQMQEVEIDEKVKKDIDQNENISEAMSALQVLGYNKKEIEKVLEKEEIKDMQIEDIIRLGLKILGG